MPACPHCNAQYTLGKDFCENCGGELPQAGAQPVAGVASAPPAVQPAPATFGATSGNGAAAAIAPASAVGATVICPHPDCGKTVAPGAFCEECGRPLTGAAPAAAVQSLVTQPQVAAMAPARLVVQSTGREIPLPTERAELTIGRADAPTNSYPDVDLGLDPNAHPSGVGRKHALLRRDPSGQWLILDGETTPTGMKPSTNGTTVLQHGRSERLQPEQSLPLSSGAEIVLGNYRVTFLS